MDEVLSRGGGTFRSLRLVLAVSAEIHLLHDCVYRTEQYIASQLVEIIVNKEIKALPYLARKLFSEMTSFFNFSTSAFAIHTQKKKRKDTNYLSVCRDRNLIMNSLKV